MQTLKINQKAECGRQGKQVIFACIRVNRGCVRCLPPPQAAAILGQGKTNRGGQCGQHSSDRWCTRGGALHRRTRRGHRRAGLPRASPSSLTGPLLFLGGAAPDFPLGATASTGSTFTSAPQGDKRWVESIHKIDESGSLIECGCKDFPSSCVVIEEQDLRD